MIYCNSVSYPLSHSHSLSLSLALSHSLSLTLSLSHSLSHSLSLSISSITKFKSRENKLECLSLTSYSQYWLIFTGKSMFNAFSYIKVKITRKKLTQNERSSLFRPTIGNEEKELTNLSQIFASIFIFKLI
jgi:hypothetical protein